MTIQVERGPRGRFVPGQSGNPRGGNKRLTTEQRIERALTTHGPAILDRAFIEAKSDNAVLAGLLSFLATCQAASNLNTAAQLGLAAVEAHGGPH